MPFFHSPKLQKLEQIYVIGPKLIKYPFFISLIPE